MNKDEYAFLPEAVFGGVQEQEDEEELDPYFRPDAVSGEDEPDGLDWLPETPPEPRPCGGAEIPENPSWAFMHMVEYRRNQKQLRETPALPSNLTSNTAEAHLLLQQAIAGGATALDTR